MNNTLIRFDFAVPLSINMAEVKPQEEARMIMQHHPLIIIVLEGDLLLDTIRHKAVYPETSIAFIESDLPALISCGSDSKPVKILILALNKDYYCNKYPLLANAFFENSTQNQDHQLIADALNVALIVLIHGIESYNTLQLLTDDLVGRLATRHQYFSSCLYKESLKSGSSDDEKLLEDLMEYIGSNYHMRPSLQEFAESIHLSPGYVSHLLSKKCGKSFQDILSQTRCMKSLASLMDPEYRISELSYDVGFSSPVYFVKNFKKVIGVSPSEVRNLFCSHEYEQPVIETDRHLIETEVKRFAKKNHFDLSEMTDTIFTSDRISPITTVCDYENLLSDMGRISNIKSAMTESAHKAFDEMQKVFRITVITIDVKTTLMNCDTPTLLSISRNINHLINTGFSVALETKETSRTIQNAISSFLIFYSNAFQDNVGHLKILFRSNRLLDYKQRIQADIAHQIITKTGLHVEVLTASEYVDVEYYYPAIYDSFILTPFAMDELLNPKNWPKEIAFSLIDEVQENGTFLVGGNGLLAWNGIKKPWWYAYMLVAKLRGSVISQGKDHIITNENGRIAILTFNLCRQEPDILRTIHTNEQLLDIIAKNSSVRREHNFHITDVSGTYKITNYSLGQNACLFSRWADLNFPVFLTGDEEEILSTTCQPNVDFRIVDASGTLNITTIEESFGVSLVLLEKINQGA